VAKLVSFPITPNSNMWTATIPALDLHHWVAMEVGLITSLNIPSLTQTVTTALTLTPLQTGIMTKKCSHAQTLDVLEMLCLVI
jgi:hypothetical protein